ncbi:MAG TPA: hypothetical protein VGS04_07860 [Nitrososphaerales archaeon]|nr:hypothetical protein [Nitrososphaerales archaeon]
MRKITVALEESTYSRLIDYVAESSKKNGSRLSVSGSASELIDSALSSLPQKSESEVR